MLFSHFYPRVVHLPHFAEKVPNMPIWRTETGKYKPRRTSQLAGVDGWYKGNFLHGGLYGLQFRGQSPGIGTGPDVCGVFNIPKVEIDAADLSNGG